MKIKFKKADRAARKQIDASTPALTFPTFRNRVAYAAALEILG